MTRPLNRLAPHQPPAASNKYGPWLFKRYNRAAAAKQPPAKRAPAPPPVTKLPGLLFLWATAASRGPSPVLEPTLTPIGKMCVFQVSKYCHLPESSMAGPFKRGEGVAYCARPPAWLSCNRGACGLTQQPIHRTGQGNSPGTAGVSKSNIPIWLISILPDWDAISSFNFLHNKRPP